MDKGLLSALLILGLSGFAPAARADDPEDDAPPAAEGEPAAAPAATGEAATPAGAIGGGGAATGGSGVQRGAKDRAASGGPSSAAQSSVPHGEGLGGLGKGKDSCAGLPAQGRSGAIAEAKRLNGKLASKSSPDAIDLRKVVYVKGVSIADWPITSTIKDVKVGGKSICVDHTNLGSGKWDADFFGDPKVRVEGNQWIFAFIKGRWYGGAGEWIRPAQLCKSVDAANVGCGVFYDSEPLKSWRPAHDELVGVAVSAPARAGQWSDAERSNVVLVPWP